MKNITKFLKFKSGFILASLILICFSCSLQKQSVNASSQQQSANLQGGIEDKKAGEELKRYELGGGNDDSISVLLPAQPEDFPGVNFKAPPDIVLPSHLYMLAKDATNYFAVFISLPKESDAMTANQKGDIFYGCWRSIAGRVQEILQQRFNSQFEITSSEQQTKIENNNNERRAQDFTLGSQKGRAQIVFSGRRAYMLVSIWNPADSTSESYATQFLRSFKVRIRHQELKDLGNLSNGRNLRARRIDRASTS